MLTLAVIAKHGAESYRRLIDSAVPWVDDVVVCLDDDPEPGILGYRNGDVDYFERSLVSDFSAQRNAVMDRIKHGWVLWLDTDENLGTWMWENVRCGISEFYDLFWIPRANYIKDYSDSEMVGWPDYQPKLMKHHVRWRLPLHETPANPERLSQWKFPAELKYAVIHRKTYSDWQKASKLYSKIQEQK